MGSTAQLYSQYYILSDTLFDYNNPSNGWTYPADPTIGDKAVVLFGDAVCFYEFDSEWRWNNVLGSEVLYAPSIDSLKNIDSKGIVMVESYHENLDYGGGFFYWSEYTDLDDDGGNTFNHNISGHWLRSKPEYRATYFGAVDESDLEEINKTHSGVEIFKMYEAAEEGAQIIFDSGFTFVDYHGIKSLKEIKISGYGSVWKVGDEISTTLSSPPTNTHQVSVTELNGLEVGMSVAIPNGSNSTQNVLIEQIDGNVLTLSENITSSETQLTTSVTLFVTASLQSQSTVTDVVIRGLEFDGNRQNQSWAWWQNHVLLYLTSHNTVLTDILMKDAQCEAIIFGGDHSKMDNITILRSGGNAIHLGAAYYWTASNITIDSTQLYIGDSGHEDGAFILSNDCTYGNLNNMYVSNSLAVLGSLDSEGNGNNTFTNIRGKNCDYFIEGAGSIGSGGERTANNIFETFHCENCGSIRLDYSQNTVLRNGTLLYTEPNSFYSSAVIFDRNSFNNRYENLSIDLQEDSITTAMKLETGSIYTVNNCRINGGLNGVVATNNTIDIRISNTTIEEIKTLGIAISGISSFVNKCTFRNEYADNNYRAIYATENVTISGNQIDIIDGESNSYGILCAFSTSGKMIVKDNIVRNSPLGKSIRLQSSINSGVVIDNLMSTQVQDFGSNNKILRNEIVTGN